MGYPGHRDQPLPDSNNLALRATFGRLQQLLERRLVRDRLQLLLFGVFYGEQLRLTLPAFP